MTSGGGSARRRQAAARPARCINGGAASSRLRRCRSEIGIARIVRYQSLVGTSRVWEHKVWVWGWFPVDVGVVVVGVRERGGLQTEQRTGREASE